MALNSLKTTEHEAYDEIKHCNVPQCHRLCPVADSLQDFCPVMSMKLIKYGHGLYNLALGSNEALYPKRTVLKHNNSII